MNSKALEAQLSISRFQLLARTDKAELDGEAIVGRYSAEPLVVTSAARLCERVANLHDSPVRILEFTLRYAPLVNTVSAGADFRLELRDWRDWRTRFRNHWDAIVKFSRHMDLQEKHPFDFPRGSQLFFSKRGNTLQLDNLLHLIDLCFNTLSWAQLRICAAPDCPNPYFVTNRPKERFCNRLECKDWNDRRMKRESWNRNKDRWIAQQKKKRGGR